MKPIISNILKYSYFSLFIFFTNSSGIFAQEASHLFDSMMNKCNEFCKMYSPTYILDGDTLVVSRIRMPSSDINQFLFECIKKKDFRPLKYAVVIIMKQNYEYLKKDHEDYLLDNINYSHNGFVEMIRCFLKLNKSDDEYLAPMFTGELCKLIYKKRHKIIDFKYVKEEMNLK
jgi:hypothetical protein